MNSGPKKKLSQLLKIINIWYTNKNSQVQYILFYPAGAADISREMRRGRAKEKG
jgi:hypothetical protein